MSAIEGLILALVLVSVLWLFLFIWVFEKLEENKRRIEHEASEVEYWCDKLRIVDTKVAQLYKKDEHGFERPTSDIREDNVTREMNDMYRRLYKLEEEQSFKEVK